MLGNHAVNPPVVLAPMAGITNVAFRRLCREQGGGVYVCEMITTRALVERIPKTLKMITFAEDEGFRSLQLYGVDPDVTAAAVRMVGRDNLADHVDPVGPALAAEAVRPDRAAGRRRGRGVRHPAHHQDAQRHR